MTTSKRVGDLEIAEDMEFQRRSWVAERVGWVVLVAILAAGLLGLCGSFGPLDGATAGDEGGPLAIGYSRFVRHGGQTEIQIRSPSDAVDRGAARVWLEERFLAGFFIEAIVPEPDATELGPERITYVFTVGEAGGPLTVTFLLRPERYGRHTGRIGLPDGPSYRLRQFIYP